MLFLKADTNVEVLIGPAVAVGDGFTPVTTLSLSTADEAEIIKHNGATALVVTSISANTMAAITGADGYYTLDLTTGNLDTEGPLSIVINDDSLILPIRQDYMVVNANVYDSLFAVAGTDTLDTQVAGIDASAITATAIASNAITAAKIATDAITADKIAADAIGASELATDAVNEIVDQVWDEAQADHVAVGSFGLIASEIATIDTVVDGIQADLDNGTDGLGAIKAETALIVADTNELQTDWADAGRLDAILDARASQATADAIETDTQDIQARLPAALVSGKMDSDVTAISGDTTAADRLEALMDGTLICQVNDAAATTTAFAADGFTEATDDHFNGRLITFISGALTGQQTDITDYDAAGGAQGSQEFTVTALTEAPANNDFFVIH